MELSCRVLRDTSHVVLMQYGPFQLQSQTQGVEIKENYSTIQLIHYVYYFYVIFSNSSIVLLLNENNKTISFLGDLFKLYKRVRDLTSSLLDFLKVFPIILGFAACARPRDLVAREIRSTCGKSRSLPVYSVYNCAEHPRVVGKGFDCSVESDTCKGTCTCEPHQSKKNEKSGVDKALNFPDWGLISVEEKSRTESYRTSLRSSGFNENSWHCLESGSGVYNTKYEPCYS